MKLFEGKILKPKRHIRDWDDSLAEVYYKGRTNGKWLIIVDGNFSGWYSEEEAENDFLEMK